MKRLSKPQELNQENINKIPYGTHGIYLLRDKDGKVMYVGIA